MQFFKSPKQLDKPSSLYFLSNLVNYENKGFDHAKIVKIDQNSPLFVKE